MKCVTSPFPGWSRVAGCIINAWMVPLAQRPHYQVVDTSGHADFAEHLNAGPGAADGGQLRQAAAAAAAKRLKLPRSATTWPRWQGLNAYTEKLPGGLHGLILEAFMQPGSVQRAPRRSVRSRKWRSVRWRCKFVTCGPNVSSNHLSTRPKDCAD